MQFLKVLHVGFLALKSLLYKSGRTRNNLTDGNKMDDKLWKTVRIYTIYSKNLHNLHIWMSCKLGPINHLLSKSPNLFASIIVFRLKLPENKGDTKTHRVQSSKMSQCLHFGWLMSVKEIFFNTTRTSVWQGLMCASSGGRQCPGRFNMIKPTLWGFAPGREKVIC